MAIDFNNNTTTSPFQLAQGSFVSPEVAKAQGLTVQPNQYLMAPSAAIAAEFEQPPPGVIRERGTLANLQGQASIKSALDQTTAEVAKGYDAAGNLLSGAQSASNLAAKNFLATNTDVNALNSFVKAGTDATSRLAAIQGLSGAEAQTAALSALRESPAFQFKLSQGQGALERAASAKGLLNSGAFAKELTEYAQGLASSTINEQVSQLGDLAQTGLSAAGTKAGIATSVESQRASTDTALAQAQAQAQTNQAELLASTRQGFSAQLSTLQSQLSAQQQQLAISRAELATNQANVITQQATQANAVKDAAKNSPAAIAMLQQLRDAQAIANRGGAGFAQASTQVNTLRKQLLGMGLTQSDLRGF